MAQTKMWQRTEHQRKGGLEELDQWHHIGSNVMMMMMIRTKVSRVKKVALVTRTASLYWQGY